MIENDLGGVERLTISYSDRFIRPKLSSLFALDQRRTNVIPDSFGNQEGAQIAFRRWSCADAAYHAKDQDERKIFLELGSDFAAGARSPGTSLRGLCILNVLSSRALNKGGGPLLGDTLSVLVALRVGIFGF